MATGNIPVGRFYASYSGDCTYKLNSRLPDTIDKIEIKHRVAQDEAEQVFFNNPHYRFIESGYRSGEDVYAAMGRTDAGRYLIVFFIYKLGHLAFILSARDMDKKERRRYERR